MESKRRAIAFLRVSTDKQKTDRQKLDLEAYAKANDIVIGEWLEYKISGSKAEVYIHELYNKAKKYDFVIFQEVSRIGRSMKSTAELISKLHNKKIGVIITSQNIQTIRNGKVDPSANLLINILTSLAVHETDNSAVRIKSGIEARRAKGLPIGRPVGSSEADLLMKPKNKKIVDRLIRGMSIREICFLLNTSISQVQRIKKLAIAKGAIKSK